MSVVSSQQQRTLIQQFVVLTNASASSATKYLGRNGWRLEPAVDSFFSDRSRRGGGGQAGGDGSYTSSSAMTKNLEKIFARFKEPDEEHIGLEGTQQFSLLPQWPQAGAVCLAGIRTLQDGSRITEMRIPFRREKV